MNKVKYNIKNTLEIGDRYGIEIKIDIIPAIDPTVWGRRDFVNSSNRMSFY